MECSFKISCFYNAPSYFNFSFHFFGFGWLNVQQFLCKRQEIFERFEINSSDHDVWTNLVYHCAKYRNTFFAYYTWNQTTKQGEHLVFTCFVPFPYPPHHTTLRLSHSLWVKKKNNSSKIYWDQFKCFNKYRLWYI